MKEMLMGVLVIFLFLNGCNSQSSYAQNCNINQKAPKGKIGGLGIALRHLGGKSAQRKLAISRALDEIASQLGTTVSNQTIRRENINNGTKNSTMQIYSFQTTNGKIVKAKIEHTCYDSRSGELYIWMVTN